LQLFFLLFLFKFDIIVFFFLILVLIKIIYFYKGITIGPLVNYLNVKRKEIEEPTMSAKLSNRLIDHTMSCLEAIAGVNGNHYMRNK
jgi:hypothetical protein